MERKMRRFKQELSADETERILRKGRECTIAVDGDDDYPYAVPINYVYDGQRIYLHSASQGHKIDALRRNPKLSLCVIEKGDIIPEEFTTYFRSVIVFGIARFVAAETEKRNALRKLCEKYCMGLDPTDEIDKFIKTVNIIEITIDRMTGKQAIELTRQ
ncbi:MAG: pyridoxamine 5'-phosphate oxidase family protein [Muribaculaceae bacterium]|nr:pyridoxamine 5'-phosphate oxidase family protein [Muribaculaceae bacterium]